MEEIEGEVAGRQEGDGELRWGLRGGGGCGAGRGEGGGGDGEVDAGGIW